MTTPNQTPGSPTPEPGSPATTESPARTDRLRRRWLLAAGAVLALIAVLLLVLRTQPAGSGTATPPSNRGQASVVDRTNPAAVGSAFTARYAAHDPAACDLATPAYRSTLDREGWCTGQPAGPAPAITVLTGPTVCGDRALFGAQVTPPGQLRPNQYALVVLERTSGRWAVRSLLPVADRSLIQSAPCDTPTSDDGG